MPRPKVGPGHLFIAGEWRPAAGDGRLDVVDPATGDIVTTAAAALPSDVDSAVAAARAAFPAWRDTPARERARILHRAGELILERADDLAAVESLDVGKPISLCRAIDVPTAADTYDYYAALARTVEGAQRTVAIAAHASTGSSRPSSPLG